MPRFAANLSMLYTDSPVIERFERAAAAGFKAVEYLFPYDDDLGAIEDVLDRTGLEFILFNLPVGSFAAGDRGLANDPSRVEEFKTGVSRAIEIAGKLGVGKINCLVGKTLPNVDHELQIETVRLNLEYAASEMSKAHILQVFEPLNPYDAPGFLISTPSQGFALQAEINHANLKLEYDIYHAQRTEGNLVKTITEHIGAIGHVQLADSPARNEPGTGEINYPFVLDALDDAGYKGWVGLEYRPKTSTDESLGWLKNYGFWNCERENALMADRIGFIGLGIMGKPMARNLAKAGFELVIYSRTRASVDDLIAESVAFTAADSPRAVAEQTKTIITMLPDSPDVRAVVLGESGLIEAIGPGHLLIDMSTIAPATAIEVGKALAERGASALDAPVSGGEKGATTAALSIMVGGSAEDFERAGPLFEAMGKTIVHVGASGSGQIVKACNQVVVALNYAAVSEALVLGAKAGADPEKIVQVLSGGLAASRVLELKGASMIAHNFQPGFRVDLHRKDLNIALATARENGSPLPVTALVSQLFDALSVGGKGDLDHSALVTLYEDLAKTTI